ncbi:hypothetical protein BJX65DRAFT_201572 [Aspergillus insuetus]
MHASPASWKTSRSTAQKATGRRNSKARSPPNRHKLFVLVPHRFTGQALRKTKIQQQLELRSSSEVEMVGGTRQSWVFRDATQHTLFDMQAVRPVSTTFLLFTSAGAGHWRGSTGETRPSGVWTADLDELGLVEWMGVDVSQMVGIDVFGSTQINGIVRPCFLVKFFSSGVFRVRPIDNELHRCAPPA